MNNRAVRGALFQDIRSNLLKLFSAYTLQSNPTIEQILWAAFNSSRTIYDKLLKERGEKAELAFKTLGFMHGDPSGYLKSMYPEVNTNIDVDEFRLFIYSTTIDTLHNHFQKNYKDPEWNYSNPKLTSTDGSFGMKKIRTLFSDYLTKTKPNSIERYKLAHEIAIEKRSLGLSCYFCKGTNIYDTGFDAPGDFSHLNLSKLSFKRPEELGDGDFKGLRLNNSNLSHTNFENITLNAANFEASNMLEANLSKATNIEDIILDEADLCGADFGPNWTPDKRACNYFMAKHRDPIPTAPVIPVQLQPQFINYHQQSRPNNTYATGSFEGDMKKALDDSVSYTRTQSVFAQKNCAKPKPEQNNGVPAEYICPITGKTMIQPAMCFLDGFSYEYAAIKTYLELKRETPNGGKMRSDQSVDDVIKLNYNLAKSISSHKECNNFQDDVVQANNQTCRF